MAASSAEVPSPKEASPPAATCPPLDKAKVAPFEIDKKLLKVDVPPIIDEKESLAPFYERIAELARGTAKRPVRIAMYGDSNLTADQLTGHQRRLLQARFGDAGHGYVALARPWAWYMHQDVHHHGNWGTPWKQIAVTTDPVNDKQYGMNNFAAESRMAGAAVWVSTMKPEEDAKVGKAVSRFDVHFLKQKKGGSFDVLLDGNLVKTVSTKAEGFEAGFETVETSDGHHELKCVAKGDGAVRLFGATLERDPAPNNPGIIVDSLGAGSLNFQRIMMVDPPVRRAQLARRNYDLVIIWLGMNSMWLYPNRQWIADVIGEMRAALPNVPVLITTPPDSVPEGEKKSDPRIKQLEKQLQEVAAEQGVGFWSMRKAMGGDESFFFFMSHRLASPDRHHLLKDGCELMGERMLAALWTDMGTYLEKHADAGCAAK